MENTNSEQLLSYRVRCRNCGKKSEMYFDTRNEESKKRLKMFIDEHSPFPIQKQCDCDNGSIMLHDIISYSINF